MSKVRVKKAQLDYFRKLARETPLEIQAYLIGHVASPQLTVIESFEYTKAYSIQTTYSVAWWQAEYNRVNKDAETRDKRIVGSIHSHPSWDAVMSPADYMMCVSQGSRVCGICSTNNNPERKTRVRFWMMDSPLPCEIVYAKSKQSEKVRVAGAVPDRDHEQSKVLANHADEGSRVAG